MKNRTLVTITAALITTAAILLTAGLSLLHGSAFNEATIDEAPVPTVDEPVNVPADDTSIPATEDEVQENTEVIIPVNPPAVDEIETPEISEPIYSHPDFEYTLGDARDFHYCGCDKDCYGGGNCSHSDLIDGVVIDIYSHKTGALVGQMAIESDEIRAYTSKLFNAAFDPWAQTFEPDSGDEAVNLPEGDYRIEVYGGAWWSYTYGVHGIYELTQCTLTFYGNEELTSYIDYLIADYIAEIEAGNVEAPEAEMAVSKLQFGGLEGYWYGEWIEGNAYEPGYWYEGAGRWTERFPYIED